MGAEQAEATAPGKSIASNASDCMVLSVVVRKFSVCLCTCMHVTLLDMHVTCPLPVQKFT